ncbi:MAG: flagellar basal body rod protein FlgC [Deltaproteobacteria bacterium]|nr:flagellar basal body rod protein FlgC [Deltaproteobacteria bacterium]
MDFFSALKVSASGLTAQRTRLDIATANLANAESTRGADGQPYRRRDPVLEAASFEGALGQVMGPEAPVGVRVADVVEDPGAPRRVYLPGHPDADGQGFVALPNVDPVHEVVNLLGATRSYEANATAFETVKALAQRALDIMR